MGPDLNGRYGGMQVVGGLEATVRESDGLTTPRLNDYFGNVLATISGGSASWNPMRVSGYGPVLGYRASALTLGTPMADTLVWRSRSIDPSGFYYLGARYYDPVAGHFLSPDPLGHRASLDLYSFCDGDSLNRFDPDGRIGKAVVQTIVGSLELGVAVGEASIDLGAKTLVSAVKLPVGLAVSDLGLLIRSQALTSAGASWLGSGITGLADVVGKAWASPNDAIGLALGVAGLPFGATPTVGHNGIQFENNPLSFGGDITFGNVMNFSPPFTDPQGRVIPMGPDDPIGGNLSWTYGDHEMQHTIQAEILGPFYLPGYLSGIIGALFQGERGYDVLGPANWMETGPYNPDTHNLPPKPWP
jgi:RHS repeat-associated protein